MKKVNVALATLSLGLCAGSTMAQNAQPDTETEFAAWAGFVARPSTERGLRAAYQTTFSELSETITSEPILAENGQITHQREGITIATVEGPDSLAGKRVESTH